MEASLNQDECAPVAPVKRVSSASPPNGQELKQSRYLSRRNDSCALDTIDAKEAKCRDCQSRQERWQRVLQKLKWVSRGLGSHKEASFLFPEHWLEAVDEKHRVGSGLNHYFSSWLRSSTDQDFFTWLDSGEGKDLDLSHYPRDSLESNRVTYLNENDREAYAVYVRPEDGKLAYRLTNELVNTEGASLKTKNGSIWIYVMSTDKVIYIARKVRGAFHHSSFLGGACVIAAGRITVDHGQLTGIAPHSGHYRTSPEQFTLMLKCLQDMGVDMSQTQVEWVKEHHIGTKRLKDKTQRRASQLAALNGDAPMELLVQTRMVDIDEEAAEPEPDPEPEPDDDK